MPPAISNSSRESSAAADGDKDPQKTPKNKVMVVIDKVTAFAYPGNIDKIICHREHQFLVRWKTSMGENMPPEIAPHSWIRLAELKGPSSALLHVQDYIEDVRAQHQLTQDTLLNAPNPRKRKESPLSENGIQLVERPISRLRKSSSPLKRTIFAPIKPIQHSQPFDFRHDYNCSRTIKGDRIVADHFIEDAVDSSMLPTPTMRARANNTSLDWAEAAVAEQYRHMLSSFARKKPRVKFANDIDNGSPPLRVQLIDEYMYGDDVEPPDDATILGCQRPCKPHMVHNCGCEHSRECDCLEFAEVDKDRLRDSDLKQYKATKNGTDGDTMGLPKRFPYKMDGTMQSACLGSETRYALYECNTKCNCGPNCKTKVTQRGRKYGLEIFKTKDRGWGLRSTSDLRKGDFVDMYFGKVITYREAESRDNNDYLFDLDKFEVPKEIMLVVDGTNMGGVTRFMNHSCEPNCGIYSISYNKNDVLRYNLAFFAQEPISKGEELTFDYMGSLAYEYDADDFEAKISSSQKPAKSRMKCNCGTSSCRGYLFL